MLFRKNKTRPSWPPRPGRFLLSFFVVFTLNQTLVFSGSGDKVSLKLQDTPLRTALKLLTEQTTTDIVFSDELVVNMVDVGEETGELDTMLYKVADTYDEEVAVLTESLVSMMEPILIVGLGLVIGFIVIALFLPLIKLIQTLS